MKSIQAIIRDRETIAIGSRASVLEAARIMASRRVGALAVVDDDVLTGIVSERDVLTRVVAVSRSPEATLVGDIMTSTLIVAALDEGYEVCLRRMQQAHIRHLLVLDRERLVGIVSLRELLVADLEEKEQAITLLNDYVHYVPADLHSRERG
jgi:CBS domain-containing protein